MWTVESTLVVELITERIPTCALRPTRAAFKKEKKRKRKNMRATCHRRLLLPNTYLRALPTACIKFWAKFNLSNYFFILPSYFQLHSHPIMYFLLYFIKILFFSSIFLITYISLLSLPFTSLSSPNVKAFRLPWF